MKQDEEQLEPTENTSVETTKLSGAGQATALQKPVTETYAKDEGSGVSSAALQPTASPGAEEGGGSSGGGGG